MSEKRIEHAITLLQLAVMRLTERMDALEGLPQAVPETRQLTVGGLLEIVLRTNDAIDALLAVRTSENISDLEDRTSRLRWLEGKLKDVIGASHMGAAADEVILRFED